MTRQRFEGLVQQALADLPKRFREALKNIAVVVEEEASPGLLREYGYAPEDHLLGLYEGIPLPERGAHYGNVLPDKITIFQRPLEALCRSDEEVIEQIRETLIHEVAHYFGIDDDRLDELGL